MQLSEPSADQQTSLFVFNEKSIRGIIVWLRLLQVRSQTSAFNDPHVGKVVCGVLLPL